MKHLRLLSILTLALLFNVSTARKIVTTNNELASVQHDELSSIKTKDGRIDYERIMIPAKLTDRPEQILKRVGYVVSYNKELRLPNWVAWHLTASHLEGTASRKNMGFEEDVQVPAPRATHQDYVRSGYDRGHMCPAGDNKWSKKAMEQSFLMTNVCPQNPNLNRGDWHEMENACRAWAESYGDVVVIAGPILYKGNHKKIGKNKVVVPEAFFKVVLTFGGKKPQAVGFIYKNNPGDRPKDSYINTIDQVERITGIDFFPALPDDIEDKLEKYDSLL